MWFRLVWAVVFATATTVAAADLRVLSAGAVESAVRKLAKHYERELGRDVDVTFATGPAISKSLATGTAVDVVIAPAGVIANAIKSSKVDVNTQAEVARVGVGVAVRRGLQSPRVDTVDALREALLRAEGVVYNEASTGKYLEKLFDRMAIVDQLKPKTTRYASAAQVLEHIIRGAKNEIGFGPITEIKDFQAQGITFAGPLPAEVQHYTTYVAAVMSEAHAPDAGRDFIRYLTSAKARQLFAATGVESSR
jgi:molybdate transport system substrate-binding protein